MGIEIDLDIIHAVVVTEYISRIREINVEAFLLIKNPLSRPLHKTSLFLHPFLQLGSGCE